MILTSWCMLYTARKPGRLFFPFDTQINTQQHLHWLSMVDISEQEKLLPTAFQRVSLPGKHPRVKNGDSS